MTPSDPAPSAALPRYAEVFLAALHRADVRLVAAVPESLLKAVFAALPHEPGIRYVRASNEADLPGIVAGAYLGGMRALMMMENSGLRQACEPIARFSHAHHLPLVMAVSHRGDFGETNWWGHNHHQVMVPLLDALRIPLRVVDRLDRVEPELRRAFVHADASQWPVCLAFAGECVEGGLDAAA
jgi:sulfopyruvate decarboxylase subunit alpha